MINKNAILKIIAPKIDQIEYKINKIARKV
jgi:hypothetical protein